jgi:hypothetical protein
MRFALAVSTAYLLGAAAVQAAVIRAPNINCGNTLSSGVLTVYKNSLTGQEIPLTIDSTGSLAGSTDGSQQILNIVGCNSTHIGKPAVSVNKTTNEVTIYGKINNNVDCLTRMNDGHLAMSRCVGPDDSSQDTQFFTTTLVYQTDGQFTGSQRKVAFVESGYFHHLTGGKLYGTRKQVVLWQLRFTKDRFLFFRNHDQATVDLDPHLLVRRVRSLQKLRANVLVACSRKNSTVFRVDVAILIMVSVCSRNVFVLIITGISSASNLWSFSSQHGKELCLTL